MKKIFFLSTMMLVMMMVAMLPQNVKAQVSVWDGTYTPWTNGTGTEADPFLIENAQQLAYLANRVNNGLDAAGGHVSNHSLHYKLMIDVNLNGSQSFQWTPIGYWISETNYYSFGGHFDGNNHTVSGLYINSSANRVGFFGYTDGATIKNLSVSGDTVATTGRSAGGIVGYANETILISCLSASNVSSNTSYYYSSGGIVGQNSGITTITNCYNTGNISSSVSSSSYYSYSYSGGIVGLNAGGTAIITNCYNTGNISSSASSSYSSSSSSYSGGIVGLNDGGTAIITNCYNTGNISSSAYSYSSSSSSYSGGIVGKNGGTTTITNCYNTGNVSSSSSYFYSGGIVGDGSGQINNCYYRDNCGGNNTYGGSPMSSAVMQTQEFLDILNNGTCAYEMDVVPSINQGYPILTMVVLSAKTLNATNVTQSHATLNGILTVMNDSIVSFGYRYKSTMATAYVFIPCSTFSDTVTTTLSGLQPSTSYQYSVYMLTAGCDTTFGETKSFTTLGVSVTTNSATDLTENSATLNGAMNMGDATVTNQGFEYRAVGDANFATVSATGSTDNFSAPLYGLTVNTQYEYRAFVNIAGSTEPYYGNIQTFEVSWLNADTILIYDADMLQWVSDRCNTGTTFEGKYIKLMNNIVLPLNQPNNMTSIGVYPNYPFKGTFDGNGMTITNLYIDQPNTPYQGFFGYTLNANLYQVGLVNITASGRNYTGGMVAYADNTYMRDCYVNGGSLFALSYCGGLVGYQSEGTNSIISGCYNTCTVSGTSYVGGLVGFSNYATVRNSYVAASVAAQGTAVGAIIGGANEVLMYNCYFSTSITGQSNAIGEHNFRDGEGLSNEEMQSTQFVATLNQGLVTPVWKSDYAVPINNGFPILIWQYSDAEACEAPENLSYTISGNSATLTWDGGDNASYFTVEYGMSGDDVHTENTSNHLLVIHDLQNGNYFWRVKSVCSFGESNFVNGSTIETGINNHKQNASLNVYPNPTTDIVNVELTINNGQSGDVAIQVYDMYGKLLDVVNVGNTDAMNRVPTDHSVDSYGVANTHGLSAQTTQIDLSRYTNGVYFIKAVSEGNVLTVRKVVKNR